MSTCFVTVGSTQFDALIEAVLTDEVQEDLRSLGITQTTLQTGAGTAIDSAVPEGLRGSDNGGCFVTKNGMKIDFFRYKKNIHEDMASAKLIIGHAGAGTCLEAIELGKPLIAVINDKLMDNHQSELADRLAELGCLTKSTPSDLAQALKLPSLLSPKPLQKAPTNAFANYLYDKLGYVTS
uniref:UDP-N-acetylglucosamine transferase subunit ALG13 n=1 Tax=Panagrellus redivivus TaxID=6233 RepID=A0A7E5A0M3_PANRE